MKLSIVFYSSIISAFLIPIQLHTMDNRDNIDNTEPTDKNVRLAVDKQDVKLLRRLLINNANPNAISSKSKELSESVLYDAIESDNLEMLATLLIHKANPDGISANTASPVLFAEIKEKPIIVRLLLSYGAQIPAGVRIAVTPLEKAALEGPSQLANNLEQIKEPLANLYNLLRTLRLIIGQGKVEQLTTFFNYLSKITREQQSSNALAIISTEITSRIAVVNIILQRLNNAKNKQQAHTQKKIYTIILTKLTKFKQRLNQQIQQIQPLITQEPQETPSPLVIAAPTVQQTITEPPTKRPRTSSISNIIIQSGDNNPQSN